MDELLHDDLEVSLLNEPPVGVLFSGHYVDMPYGYYGHRPKGRKDWLIIYTVSGEGRFRVNKEVLPSIAGDVVILPPDLPHHYATAKGHKWELMWAHFLPVPDWNRWLQLPRTEEQLIYMHVQDAGTRQRIYDAFARMVKDGGDNGKWSGELARISLSEVLVLLQQQHEQTGESAHDERIVEMLHYFAANLSEPLQLPDLAKKCGLSVSRLCHLFKEQVGETIVATLLRMRLEKSAKLLEFTSRQIAEISHDVGFGSPFYFTRKFTASYGISPTAYRKQAQLKWKT